MEGATGEAAYNAERDARIAKAADLVDQARELVASLTVIRNTGGGSESERRDVSAAVEEAEAGLRFRLAEYNAALRS